MIKIKKNPHIDEYGINSSIKNNTRYIKIVIASKTALNLNVTSKLFLKLE